MKKTEQQAFLGYFTNETAHSLVESWKTGLGRPVAVHIEAQNTRWALIGERTKPGDNPALSHHGDFCVALLAGAPHQTTASWDTGFMDEFSDRVGNLGLIVSALHPDVRVVSISSQSKILPRFRSSNFLKLQGPVVLKSAGNNADDWFGYRADATVSGELFMPAYLRVGEALPTGEVHPHSQVSGPAFICDHPRIVKDVLDDKKFFPTFEDVRAFLDWPGHEIPEDCAAFIATYRPPVKDMEFFDGTSASAPHAGAMIMRHTAGMEGITSYDIVPAVLMAAQMNYAPPDAVRSVETQSGMIFDPFHYGHGILVEECLKDRLSDIWDVRSRSGKATRSGEYSGVHTVEGRGHMSVRTEKAQGPVVNTIVDITFANDETDRFRTEARIPQFMMMRSPQGTIIHLPLLYERRAKYGTHVRAAYQTAAFFGEDVSKGEWRIVYSQTSVNPLPIVSTKIIAHTMHEKSPAHVYFKAFRKAMADEGAQENEGPATMPAPSLKP